jgi:hypothetical protein
MPCVGIARAYAINHIDVLLALSLRLPLSFRKATLLWTAEQINGLVQPNIRLA